MKSLAALCIVDNSNLRIQFPSILESELASGSRQRSLGGTQCHQASTYAVQNCYVLVDYQCGLLLHSHIRYLVLPGPQMASLQFQAVQCAGDRAKSCIVHCQNR